MRVVVASKNPVKLASATEGFARMFPGETFEVVGVSVPSGVSDQPMSDAETLAGAMNRAENASKAEPDADFWVGHEGGCHDNEHGLQAFAWIVVRSRDGKVGKGKTGTFFLPPPVTDLVRQGVELGKADDIVFRRTNSKQESGACGLLTGDAITRTTFYVGAVILALIPFKNRELFE